MVPDPPYHLLTVASTPESATVNNDGYYLCERDETILEPTGNRASASGDTQWHCETCETDYWLGDLILTPTAHEAMQSLADSIHPDEAIHDE